MSGGGSSSGKGLGRGRGKGGRKGPPIIWEGSLGPDSFDEPIEEFPLQTKSEFSHERPLRHYDNRTEDWPKCRHGLDCVVQMYNDCDGGGRRFYRCPQGWDSRDPENCGFTRWVDPPPIYPHELYIIYLQGRVFDLENGLGSGNRDTDEDDYSNDGEEVVCNDPYCQCPYHKKHGPPPPAPPPPPPPPLGGYCGEGSTQFAMWDRY